MVDVVVFGRETGFVGDEGGGAREAVVDVADQVAVGEGFSS